MNNSIEDTITKIREIIDIKPVNYNELFCEVGILQHLLNKQNNKPYTNCAKINGG